MLDVSATSPDPAGIEPEVDAALAGRPSLIGRLLAARGIWALGDQGIISLGNFLTTVFMARGLKNDSESFGVYSLIFSVLLFLNSIHGSLISYPMTLRMAPAGMPRYRELAMRALTFTLTIAPAVGLVIVFACGWIHRLTVLPWAIAAMLLWQGQETVRRALLAKLEHRKAIPGDAISFLGQAVVVFFLSQSGSLTPELAFAGIAATSGLAFALQLTQLLKMAGPRPVVATVDVKPEATDWWRDGRWLALACLVNVPITYLIPWVLESAQGPRGVASLSAIAAILNLTNPILFSLSGLIVPAVAAAWSAAPHTEIGLRQSRQALLKYGLMGVALVVPYYLLVLCAPRLLLQLFYQADSPYVALADSLRLLVPTYACIFVAQLCLSMLAGLGEGRRSFFATFSGAVTSLILNVPIVWAFGLTGVVLAGPIPILVQMAVAMTLLRRFVRQANLHPTDSADVTQNRLVPAVAGGAQ